MKRPKLAYLMLRASSPFDGVVANARRPHPKGGGDPEAEAGKHNITETGSEIWHTNGDVRYVLAEFVLMAGFVVTSATTAAIMTGWAENHTRRVTIMKYLVVSMPERFPSTKVPTDSVQTLLPGYMQRPSHTTFAIAFTLYFLTTVLYSCRQHEGTCQGQTIAMAMITTIGLGLKMCLPLQSIVLSLGSWILIIALLLSRGLEVLVWRYQ